MARGIGGRRSPGVWRRLDVVSRYAWPAAVLVLGLFLIGLPFGLPGQAEMRPAYAMGCVFFWSLYRPSSLPAPVVACVGLLLDLLVFAPLGVWAVLLLLLQGAAIAGRRRLLPLAFPVIWLVFCGFAAVLSGLAWGAQSLLYLHMLPSLPLGAQVLAAAGVYPALAGVFIRAHRGAAAAELA